MLTILARALRGLLLLAVGALLAITGAWVLLALAGVAPTLHLNGPGASLILDPAAGGFSSWLVAGILLCLAGLLSTMLALAPGPPAQPARVVLAQPSPDGSPLPGTTVTLSTRSLHSLVTWLGGRVEGVRAVVPQVRLTPGGWDVHCAVDVWATASVPQVADHLRQALHAELLHHTGVAVDALQLDFAYGDRHATRAR